MGEVTHEQANLLLRLYELRREPRLREARAWFIAHFEAKTPEELTKKYPSGDDANASFRMVISYWDMVAGLANRGLIDEDLFFESSGEAWVIWDRIREIAPAMRETHKHPRLWTQLETLAKRFDEWRKRNAPDMNVPAHSATVKS